MKWAVFAYFHELLFIVHPLADVFERPTLRGCQRWDALGRVKLLRILTLPCQETNPVGVICGGAVAEISWWGLGLGFKRGNEERIWIFSGCLEVRFCWCTFLKDQP